MRRLHMTDQGTSSHAVCGGDADLILLAMANLPLTNLHIVQDEKTLVSVGSLTDAIRGLMGCGGIESTISGDRTRWDFVMLCLFRGNDYLPALRGGRTTSLLEAYAKVRARGRSSGTERYLTTADGGIDWKCLKMVLSEERAEEFKNTGGWNEKGDAVPTVSEAVATDATGEWLAGVTWCLKMYASAAVSNHTFAYLARLGPTVEDVLQYTTVRAEESGGGKKDESNASDIQGTPIGPLATLLALLPREASALAPTPLQSLFDASTSLSPALNALFRPVPCAECEVLKPVALTLIPNPNWRS